MDGHIKVNTATLHNQANTVANLINMVKENFSTLQETVNGTNSYWIGEAGDAHREKYAKQQSKFDEAIRRLTENVTDLRIMAGVYDDTERQALSEAESLIGAVID